MKSSPRPSKVDPYANEIIQWRIDGKGYRQIAALLREKGLDITFQTVGRWYRKQMSLVTRQQERTALQLQATRTVIESEWADQMQEFKCNYAAAKRQGELAEKMFEEAARVEDQEGMERWDAERRSAGPAMAVWARLYHEAWKAMLQKVVPNPRPVSLAEESEERLSVEEFRALILDDQVL